MFDPRNSHSFSIFLTGSLFFRHSLLKNPFNKTIEGESSFFFFFVLVTVKSP